jgi:hypothetical protein
VHDHDAFGLRYMAAFGLNRDELYTVCTKSEPCLTFDNLINNHLGAENGVIKKRQPT